MRGQSGKGTSIWQQEDHLNIFGAMSASTYFPNSCIPISKYYPGPIEIEIEAGALFGFSKLLL